MESMFAGCNSLISLPDLAGWNISELEELGEKFEGCLNILKISNKFENVKLKEREEFLI